MSVGIAYICANCEGKVFVPHTAAWPQVCPNCRKIVLLYSLSSWKEAVIVDEDQLPTIGKVI